MHTGLFGSGFFVNCHLVFSHVLRLHPLDLLAHEGFLVFVQFFPALLVHEKAHFHVVEAWFDTVFGLFMPAHFHYAHGRPAIAVHYTTLQRGVDLARWNLQRRCANFAEEGQVHGHAAQLETRQVCRGHRLVGVDVVLQTICRASQPGDVGFLAVNLVHQFVAAVLTQLAHGLFCQRQRQCFRHQIGVEYGGGIGEINHAGTQCVTDLERRNGLWPANDIDLYQTLAFCVDLVNELLEALGKESVHRKD